MLKRAAKSGLYVAAVFAVSAWIVGTSDAFHDCVHKHKNDNAYQALHKSSPIVVRAVVRADLSAYCAGNSADRNSGPLTLLATGLIALFTFTLWRSTDKLWEASERQLRVTRQSVFANIAGAKAADKSADVAERALTDLEGPFLYPVVESDNLQESFKPFVLYTDPSSPHAPVQPTITFNIKNYGRTPALPQTLSGVFFFGQSEDTHDDIVAGFIPELLISPGDKLSEPFRRKMVQPIGADEHLTIMRGVTRIFLGGSIVFFDIFGNRYEQKFCLAWGPVTKRFMAWGPTRNNRRRIGRAVSSEEG
jgi:hypothetical protein